MYAVVSILGCEVVCRNIHLSWFWHDHFEFGFHAARWRIECLKQAAEKVGFVIPNPRRLPVRDLLFAIKPTKKQIPHPFKNRTGFGMTYFRVFPQAARGFGSGNGVVAGSGYCGSSLSARDLEGP